MRVMSSPRGRTEGYEIRILAADKIQECLPYVYPVVMIIELSFTLVITRND